MSQQFQFGQFGLRQLLIATAFIASGVFTLSHVIPILECDNVALLTAYESILAASGAFFGGAAGVLGRNVRFGMMLGASLFIVGGWILAALIPLVYLILKTGQVP